MKLPNTWVEINRVCYTKFYKNSTRKYLVKGLNAEGTGSPLFGFISNLNLHTMSDNK